MNKVLKNRKCNTGQSFFLAPLAGITDAPTRRICREMGAALVYSEMVSGKGLYYKQEKTKNLLHIDPAEKPVAFQVFGAEPEILALPPGSWMDMRMRFWISIWAVPFRKL